MGFSTVREPVVEEEASGCLWFGYLNSLSRALNFAGSAENALRLIHWIGLLFRGQVSGRFNPVENAYRTNRNADAISVAYVLI